MVRAASPAATTLTRDDAAPPGPDIEIGATVLRTAHLRRENRRDARGGMRRAVKALIVALMTVCVMFSWNGPLNVDAKRTGSVLETYGGVPAAAAALDGTCDARGTADRRTGLRRRLEQLCENSSILDSTTAAAEAVHQGSRINVNKPRGGAGGGVDTPREVLTRQLLTRQNRC